MSRAAAEVGSTANSYQILAKLASGGMADIFLARGEGVAGVERYCVLKRILRERASDVHFVQMFLDEARLAAQLQHPNIAQVYDIGKLGDSYFFTMEYVHGETVRAVLHRAQGLRRQLPVPCVLTLVAGAAAGLHHAHGRVGLDGRALDIVHRDVSPSNLMVSYEGGVKLVDFGVAKASDRATETKSGTVKGKISYLSPEQCRGKRVDRRSDLFSLGICFWEMLTTDRLYRRSSDFENMNAIVSEPPPAPSERRADVPPELDAMVLRLLAKDPDERYQTADEVVEAIEAVASRTGATLSPTGLGRLVRELFGQRPEPWLELDAQEAREPVTVTSEPIPPELAIPAADRIHQQLAGVVDLSAPRAVTESLDLADASSIKPVKPPLPRLPGLPQRPPALAGAQVVAPGAVAKPAETLSLKPLAASARPAGTRPPETQSLSAQAPAVGPSGRPETLSLSAQDLIERPPALGAQEPGAVSAPEAAPGRRPAGASTPPPGSPAPSSAVPKPFDAVPGLRGRTPSTPPAGSPMAVPLPPSAVDAAWASPEALQVGEPTAPIGKPIKRGFPLAAPPPTQPGGAPSTAATPGSPSPVRSSGEDAAGRSTGPSPNVPGPPQRSTGPSPIVRSTAAPAAAATGDTFTEPDPTALPAPPLAPAAVRPGPTSEVMATGSPSGPHGAQTAPGAAASAAPLASPAAASGPMAIVAPAPFAASPSSGPKAVPPLGSFAPQPTLAPAQSASFAAQHAAPAVAHVRAPSRRPSPRRAGWPLYAVIIGAAILGSAAVIVIMRSGPEAANVSAVASSPGTSAPASPPEPEHRAPIVEPIESEGSAAPAASAPTSQDTGAPPPAAATVSPAATATPTKPSRPNSRVGAAHQADKHDGTGDDLSRLYASGQYDKVVAQCGLGPISADRAPLCFVAACHAGDEAAARRLVAAVPAARREQLTSNCKQLGVDVKKPDCDADPMACQH